MNANHHNDLEIGDDLVIIQTTHQVASAGTWVIGTTNGHLFNALVFPQPVECPEFELGDSRISKLWVKRLSPELTPRHRRSCSGPRASAGRATGSAASCPA